MKHIVAGQKPVTADEFAETALGDYYDAGAHALRDIRAMIEAEGDEIDRASLPYYDELITAHEQERAERMGYYNALVRKSPLPRRQPLRPRRIPNHRPKSERRPAAPAISTRPAARFVLRGRSA
ncbi:hypothetical protein OG756_41690 (plasmid) [Streptomyces sp. NBC_01310]|uniref:hypothetical protein n=1 Tax=Streptomyces sp. NBC_01310 TaxID=2903820 RepID=UPI0035B62F4E|nr:hypothetical protein OG756_41690 [Streptomyces sp. NBC_01310]